jgi:hypothetical protein
MKEHTQQIIESEVHQADLLQEQIAEFSGKIFQDLATAEASGAILRQAEEGLEKLKREQYVEQLVLSASKAENAVMKSSTAGDRTVQFETWFETLPQAQEMKKYQQDTQAQVGLDKLALEQHKKVFDALRIQSEIQTAKLNLLAQIVAAENDTTQNLSTKVK